MVVMENTANELPESEDGDFEEGEREPIFLEWFEAEAEVAARAYESLTKEIYPNPELMATAMDMPAPRLEGRNAPTVRPGPG